MEFMTNMHRFSCKTCHLHKNLTCQDVLIYERFEIEGSYFRKKSLIFLSVFRIFFTKYELFNISFVHPLSWIMDLLPLM